MRRISLVAVLLILFGFSACGNKTEETTVATPPSDISTESPAASGAAMKVNDHGTKTFTSMAYSLEVEQDNDGSDFYFKPTYIKAPGASTATIKLHNEGSVQHTFTIDALHIDKELAPDEKATVVVKLGTETRYEFYCRFHVGSGMRGAFELH